MTKNMAANFVEDHNLAKPGEFHGVYLLYCLNENPRLKGRTYIGYTVNPNRRINQHNAGTKKGGARQTSERGPWEMILIIHGFPSGISGLGFEWAWQHPSSSRRLKHCSQKTSTEKKIDFNLRILSEMLNVGPWNRLPLTVQWLKQNYTRSFPPDGQPPIHMPIAYGPIKTDAKKAKKKDAREHEHVDPVKQICHFCRIKATNAGEHFVECINADCPIKAHVVCFAKKFLENTDTEYLLPVIGKCPGCNIEMLWRDVVRGRKIHLEDKTFATAASPEWMKDLRSKATDEG